MAHSDDNTQGILANQDIRNFAVNNVNATGQEGTRNVKWANNLGFAYGTDFESTGWPGGTFSPLDLQGINRLSDTRHTGPRNEFLSDGNTETAQYGPKAFARLYDKTEGGNYAPSLLTAFAWMINADSPEWGTGAAPDGDAQQMKTTFTSGSQMRSLWDKTTVNSVPIASGGAFNGYESAASRRYGKLSTDVNGIETLKPSAEIDTTGIRNIPGMTGPTT